MPVKTKSYILDESNGSWGIARKLFKDYNLQDYENDQNVNKLQQWIKDNNHGNATYKKGEQIIIPADNDSVLQIIGTPITTSKEDKIATNITVSVPEIYLTFDDGPNKATLNLIQVINNVKVKCNVFIQGQLCASASTIISKECASEYVEISNHTQTHKYLEKTGGYFSNTEFKKEIKDCYATLTKYYTNAKHKGFKIARCPGTNTWKTSSISQFDRDRVKDAVIELFSEGYIFFGWDEEWHGSDTIIETTDTLIKRISVKSATAHTKNKIVLLMHDVMFSSEDSKEQLSDLISKLKGKYEFKFLSEY